MLDALLPVAKDGIVPQDEGESNPFPQAEDISIDMVASGKICYLEYYKSSDFCLNNPVVFSTPHLTN